MNDLKNLAEYFVVFDEDDTEKEFLQKCSKQFDNIINSDHNMVIKLAHLSNIFSEIEQRINSLD